MKKLVDKTGKEYQVQVLSKELAERYADELVKIWNLVPTSEHTVEQLLAEERHGRVLHGKWMHSLVVLDGEKVVGMVVGYERKGEGGDLYPENTIYLNSLAVSEEYQKRGIGKKLIEIFLDHSRQIGFETLEGKVDFTIQTNSAEWNSYVVKLYEGLGFEKVGVKEYEDRTDVVMRLQ